MKFINSKEESYKSMIGKIYQNKSYAGKFEIQIIGFMYDPNKDIFIYIFKSLNQNICFYNIQDFKRIINNRGYKINIFNIEKNETYSFRECLLFEKYYLLLN